MCLNSCRLLQTRTIVSKRVPKLVPLRGFASFINRAAGKGREDSVNLSGLYNQIERRREELRSQLSQNIKFKTLVQTIAALNQGFVFLNTFFHCDI